MILGHAAGTAASIALDENVLVQDVNVTKLRSKLLEQKQLLDPNQSL